MTSSGKQALEGRTVKMSLKAPTGEASQLLVKSQNK